MLIKSGYTNYSGIDISVSGIQAARARLPEWAASFTQGNAYQLGAAGQSAEIIIAVEVLEHIDDLKFIHTLKAGTLLIASVPNYWSSNNEHLRIYKSRNHIKWRFRHVLKFESWAKIHRTKTRNIYVFTARVK